MGDARDFAADLLTGRRTRIGQTVSRGPAASPPSQVFAEVDDGLTRLAALRVADPNEALALFREFLHDEALTERDLDSFIEVWRTAITNPDQFQSKLASPPVVRGVGDWWDHLRAYLHRPGAPSDDDQQQLDAMTAMNYVLPSSPLAPAVNPHERMLETLDPAWVPLLGVKLGEKHWPKGLVEMPRHSPTSPYVYTALDARGTPLVAGVDHEVAFFSDFGTGYYHSWGIAEQLASWGLPYSFHLGDVYYAGRPDEFARGFEAPLATVVENTRLFGIAENHELYGGGGPYLDYFRTLHARGRTPQEGSYFCVRFPDHQVITIDVNWQGRQRYLDPALRAWLAARLAETEHRTNILCSGSAPFDYGDPDERPLLGDLRDLIGDSIDLWFWGDDHYCALFDRQPPDVPYFGSCIGHGGYPGTRQREALASYKTYPLWFEEQPRFPIGYGASARRSRSCATPTTWPWPVRSFGSIATNILKSIARETASDRTSRVDGVGVSEREEQPRGVRVSKLPADVRDRELGRGEHRRRDGAPQAALLG